MISQHARDELLLCSLINYFLFLIAVININFIKIIIVLI